jgi:hypothetical protein
LVPSIFVSYSHEDERALALLRKHLAPLEREGLAKVWADTGIEHGQEWHREIATALRSCQIAVPVCSAAFYASQYIAEREIPVMLERAAAGEAEIVPVFWSPAAEPEFDQVARSGDRKKRRLSEWQGLATPQRPMIARDRAQIERELVKFIEGLRRKIGRPSKAGKTSLSIPNSDSSARRQEGRVALSIELERRVASLFVHYRQPGQKPFQSRELDWRMIETKIADFHEPLDRYDRESFESWVAEAPSKTGAELLEMLFGDVACWAPILARIFERENAAFTLRKVDLRIVAADRALAALPWRLLAYEGRPLVAAGWTIAASRAVDPTGAVQTLPNGEVLLAAAGDDGGLADKLALYFRDVWNVPEGDPRLQVCRSAAELRGSLGRMGPHVVIATGQARRGALSFTDGSFPLAGLEAAAELKALVLACRGLHDYEPQADLPLILWPRYKEPGPQWGTQLLEFLHLWLREKQDPVEAFHNLGDDPDRATFRLLAGYRDWQIAGPAAPARRVQDLLDRIDQKARVLRECQQLAKSGSPRKVMALIAHGGPHDGIGHHGDQLVHVLETEAHSVAVKRVKLEIPAVRQDLSRDLEDQLKQLVAGPANTRQALRALGPRRTGESVPLLWLDCGSVSGSELSRAELVRWVAFADECLLPNCPADLRIVLYLGILFEEESLEAASTSLEELESTAAVQRGTALIALKRLHAVPAKELSDYLREHSACPEAGRAARLIHAASGGKFNRTVELVEQGEKSWLTLLAELETQHPAPAARLKGW